ncbi:MAG: hypothetical protein J5830_05980 [Clostridia bacterium]|nr:hypothetical protein [Clostridia bacterium]
MKAYLYYCVRTLKNQILKIFKSWIVVVFIVMVVLGLGAGILASVFSNADSEIPEEPGEEEEIDTPLMITDLDGNELFAFDTRVVVDIAATGVILLVLALDLINADKTNIFKPADAPLLFTSPLSPRSILAFRLSTTMGMYVFFAAYMLFQVPNIINGGISPLAALALLPAWLCLCLTSLLLKTAAYLACVKSPAFKKSITFIVLGILAAIAASFIVFKFTAGTNLGVIAALLTFFTSKYSRYVPVIGWIKGVLMFPIDGSAAGFAICLLLLIAFFVLMILIISKSKTDYYEVAMERSEEVAELTRKAQGSSTGMAIASSEKKKARRNRVAEKTEFTGFGKGSGANMFFVKAMYNRRKFSYFGFVTKTMIVYTAVAAVVALATKLLLNTDIVVPAMAAIGLFAFYRSLGDPMRSETDLHFLALVPAGIHIKLFWCLAAGGAGCFLDLIIPSVVVCLILGANPLSVLPWMILIVAIDLYSSSVGTFIGLAAPKNAGKTIGQVLQILFLYFGIMPVIGFIAPLALVVSPSVGALIGAAFCMAISALFVVASAPLVGRNV